MIFVFGSNLAGIHGAGAALEAHKRRFPLGLGAGLDLNSKCYAIPTKDCRVRPLSLPIMQLYVWQFVYIAEAMGYEDFQVTRIGCGLAGYKDEEVAPMFKQSPPNCYFDETWKPYMPRGTRFWGAF